MLINRIASRIVKRIIIVFGILAVLFVIVGVITIVSLFKKSGKESARHDDVSQQAGSEFGSTTDQRGCINEGLKRGKKLELLDFDPQIENEYFVRGCLESSRATPGFCDGVPSGFWNIFNDWDKKQCEKTNVITPICTGILKEQIRFCEH